VTCNNKTKVAKAFIPISKFTVLSNISTKNKKMPLGIVSGYANLSSKN
jgi:hypothetical protein